MFIKASEVAWEAWHDIATKTGRLRVWLTTKRKMPTSLSQICQGTLACCFYQLKCLLVAYKPWLPTVPIANGEKYIAHKEDIKFKWRHLPYTHALGDTIDHFNNELFPLIKCVPMLPFTMNSGAKDIQIWSSYTNFP